MNQIKEKSSLMKLFKKRISKLAIEEINANTMDVLKKLHLKLAEEGYSDNLQN